MCEGCIGIEGAVHIGQLLGCGVGGCALLTVELYYLCAEDASRKVTTVGDEVDVSLKRTLQLSERLAYLM